MPGKERLLSSAQTAAGWKEAGSPQTGSPAAWPPSCSYPPPPLTGLKVMMGNGKGLGKAAPLKWMELQGNSFHLPLSPTRTPTPPLFKITSFLITHSEHVVTKLSFGKKLSVSFTLLPPLSKYLQQEFQSKANFALFKSPHPFKHQKSFT